jgi:hypothetical protein
MFVLPEACLPGEPLLDEPVAAQTGCFFGAAVQLNWNASQSDMPDQRHPPDPARRTTAQRDLLTRGDARLLVIEPYHAHARSMLDKKILARTADGA